MRVLRRTAANRSSSIGKNPQWAASLSSGANRYPSAALGGIPPGTLSAGTPAFAASPESCPPDETTAMGAPLSSPSRKQPSTSSVLPL